MKKTAAILAIIALAILAHASPNSTITNSFTGYQYIASTNTDVGTTGVSTGTAYVCFPLTALAYLSAADAAESGGDVRELEFALIKYFYDQYYAKNQTNRTAQLTITETADYSSETNATIQFKHQIKSQILINGDDISIPGE